MRVYSFYYFKWCHLVNRLPLDNATLKLHHHGVGVSCCVCVTGSQGLSTISDDNVFSPRVTAGCGYYKWTLPHAAARRRAISHRQKLQLKHENVNFIEAIKQPRSEFGGIYCLGSASEDSLPLQKFQVCARTKKCNSRCVATTVTSVGPNSLTTVSSNGAVIWDTLLKRVTMTFLVSWANFDGRQWRVCWNAERINGGRRNSIGYTVFQKTNPQIFSSNFVQS